MTISTEPAIKSYFFGKGYRDLARTIIDSWNLNLKSAYEYFIRINTSGSIWELILSGFWGAAGLSVVVFGTFFFIIVSALHIVFLGMLFLLIYFGFTIVWGIERTFLFFSRFFSACPQCHAKNTLPVYLCNNCKEKHHHLTPNSYGILFHKCICGQKLPATFFVNRGKLQALCPDCSFLLKREHIESKRIFIPIFGGPVAGKSAFMFSIIRLIIEEKAKELGYKARFIDKKTEAEYKTVVNYLKKGKVLKKTIDTLPKAFNLSLKQGNRIKWLLYIYDPSGETYRDMEKLIDHKYHDYLSGMVLIIDPFSISSVRRNYESELSKTWSSVQPSDFPAEDALARVILTMEQSFGLSKTGKINKPIAVVISKTDAFDLEKIIGEPVVDALLKKSSIRVNRTEIRNNLIRKALIGWDEAALVQQLDARFKKVNFYSCSALGRIPDSTNDDFVPHHVFEPMYWIFNSVSSKDFKMTKEYQ